MKKLLYSALLMVAALMVSCTKEDSSKNSNEEVVRVPVTVSASFGNPISRTYLDGNAVKWSAGDVIGIIDGLCESGSTSAEKSAAIQQFTISDLSADNSSATFTGSLASGLTNYYAVYPYDATDFVSASEGYVRHFFSSTQKASAPDTFDDNYNPAVALLKDGALSFKNIGGLLKINVLADNVKKINITANDGGTVGGVYYITLNANGDISGITLASSRPSVNLVPDGSTTFSSGIYYIAVSARTYTGGLNLAFTLDDDTVKYRSTTADVVVERAKITSLGSVDPNTDTFKAVTFPVVFDLGFPSGSTVASSGYNNSDKACMAEWISGSWYTSSKGKTTATGEAGKWLCRTQSQAYMTFTWADAIGTLGVSHYTEIANNLKYYLSTPGVKGVWTDDYFEFVLPVKDFAANTTIRLTMPIYTRQGPTFWEVKYKDGDTWKTTATANLPAYDGAEVTATATWAVPYLAVTANTSNEQTVDMTFSEAVSQGELKIRVQCVDGSIISSGVNAVTTGNTTPHVNSDTCDAPFYFYNPNNRANYSDAITFAIVTP